MKQHVLLALLASCVIASDTTPSSSLILAEEEAAPETEGGSEEQKEESKENTSDLKTGEEITQQRKDMEDKIKQDVADAEAAVTDAETFKDGLTKTDASTEQLAAADEVIKATKFIVVW